MLSSHLILCRPLLLLPPVPPSMRVFSNESTLFMRWSKYWSFSFSIIPSKEIPGLISKMLLCPWEDFPSFERYCPGRRRLRECGRHDWRLPGLGSALAFPFDLGPRPTEGGVRVQVFPHWLDLLAVQGTLKSLLQHHRVKPSILRHSAFFTIQLSHPYMTTGKTIDLTRRTFVGKVMSLLFNTTWP